MDEKEMQDRHEIEISTLLDGELSGEEMRLAIDALIEDEELRTFWRSSRELDHTLHIRRGGEHQDLPGDLWDQIERQAGLSRARVIAMPRMTTRAWAAAASILLILSLSLFGVWQMPSPATATEKTVQLGSHEGQMTEERFIALTTELLQADSRYHRKMLEVMEVVNQKAYGRNEASNSGEIRTASLEASQEQPSDRPETRDVSRERTTGPIELNLW